ncbi:rCG35587 [Rattus norvegicus]|uniref:RCG35587 n=1 Tax=Rattus norvegicus TaxID=10116 RepID=A6HFM4_RAT|nr:rCG35587 [Rattus norvegicus]
MDPGSSSFKGSLSLNTLGCQH